MTLVSIILMTLMPTGPFQTLIDAENEFAATSMEVGPQKAFLTFLADEGVLFRPKPVNGKAYTAENPFPGQLFWRPRWGGIATSGDLGWTTGPWEYTAQAEGKTQHAYGHYLSVWRKNRKGKWEVVIDGGNRHASFPPDQWPDMPREPLFWGGKGFRKVNPEQGEALNGAADFSKALKEQAHSQVVVYPVDGQPEQGSAALEKCFKEYEGRKVRLERHKRFSSVNGELIADCGVGEYQVDGKTRAFTYIHISQAIGKEEPKLVVVLHAPLP